MELSDILQKRSLIEDVQSQAVNRRMTENAMTKDNTTKRQTMTHNAPHRKLSNTNHTNNRWKRMCSVQETR